MRMYKVNFILVVACVHSLTQHVSCKVFFKTVYISFFNACPNAIYFFFTYEIKYVEGNYLYQYK
jgi:hypothetical protein